ncbi:IPExxxVDY family protein [Pontibacter sp. XAAS-A31]|nr:IPExxxVDY family protein [Pontibacter harenae]
MRVLHLDIEYDYNFHLYGLVSPYKEYKLAWAINKLLNLHLIKKTDLCYDLSGKERLIISNYEFISEHSVVRLCKNRALGTSPLKKSFLLPDIKEYDYILQISGALQQLCPQETIERMLKTPLVQYIKQFDPLTLKFKENLIF